MRERTINIIIGTGKIVILSLCGLVLFVITFGKKNIFSKIKDIIKNMFE